MVLLGNDRGVRILVWKHMLLQVIVALMPVFAIQLWYDCSKDHKK